jgi:tripartite ATP-independent transporter DctM subunit
MELIFLAVLLLIMVGALSSGFPVAFALPGAAVLSIALAALCGALLFGDTTAFFAHDGPTQWLAAGITNFRGVYWDVDRDTLIAIPLFIFMGIMLQRSKIAEDLLVTMAQLFGPIPGGLGISVVFVGALLAATTGIVGATVVAMGLISLPAMLRSNYSKPLATGTICASGTLGQIIPPSIVLIILADQLSSAADQAGTLRKADYRFATGDANMPTEFSITSASAGDMFLGAFLPGLILVGLYMAYILILALIRPKLAPPVHFEGNFDWRFARGVVLALVPPLALIAIVLGSIILGIATVNQAGSIGAIGATIMAGYRLMEGKRTAFLPAALAIICLIPIFYLVNYSNLNIKNASPDDFGAITLAAISVTGLMISVLWSTWRAFKIDDTLRYVCIETAKTTSMVFIILLGAAMLTSAFRGFGGEELVKDFLTGLPGGFWGQFIVVMAVIFLLGFFLDFIEIAVVVVPIMAPILLADPSANITAVWLGVMVGVNMQTSFLTPPFGFSLFYLRGVAPPDVKTTHIYRGAVAFIILQLVGLAIVGFNPSLVNYLPNRTYLTSETAPPPQNPQLQECIEHDLAAYYDENEQMLRGRIQAMQGLDLSAIPASRREGIEQSFEHALETFAKMDEVQSSQEAIDEYANTYRPIHRTTRRIELNIRRVEARIAAADQLYNRERRAGADDARLEELAQSIARIEEEKAALEANIPEQWESAREGFLELADEQRRARLQYRRNVDDAYRPIQEFNRILAQADDLAAIEDQLVALVEVVNSATAAEATERFQQAESLFSELDETSAIRAAFSAVRREFRDDDFDRTNATALVNEALETYRDAVAWRMAAATTLSEPFANYDELLKHSIGLRMQPRLSIEQAKRVASCRAEHQDISLYF